MAQDSGDDGGGGGGGRPLPGRTLAEPPAIDLSGIIPLVLLLVGIVIVKEATK